MSLGKSSKIQNHFHPFKETRMISKSLKFEKRPDFVSRKAYVIFYSIRCVMGQFIPREKSKKKNSSIFRVEAKQKLFRRRRVDSQEIGLVEVTPNNISTSGTAKKEWHSAVSIHKIHLYRMLFQSDAIKWSSRQSKTHICPRTFQEPIHRLKTVFLECSPGSLT